MLLLRPTSAPIARRALAVTVLVASSLTLAACTQSDQQTKRLDGSRGDVQDVVQSLADRADRGDAAGICSQLFTDGLRAKFDANGGCAVAVERAINDADYTSLDVAGVTLPGDPKTALSAVATIKTIESSTARRQITFQRTSAATTSPWKISGLSTTVSGSTPATTPGN